MAIRSRCQGLILGERWVSLMAALPEARGLQTARQELPQQLSQLPLPVGRQACPLIRGLPRRLRAFQARGGTGAGVLSGMHLLLQPSSAAAGTTWPAQAARSRR